MTLTYSEIMIRYGELSTKGKNRMRFINKLRNNIQDVLSIYPAVKVTADRDRAHAYLHGTDYEPVAESLKQVFGHYKLPLNPSDASKSRTASFTSLP